MATDARVTARDLLRLSGDDVRRELVDGRVIDPATADPIKVLDEPPGYSADDLPLHEPVRRHLVVRDVGFVLSVPGDPERVPGPDIAFVSENRLSKLGSLEGFVVGASELAVEVLSASDPGADVQQRVRDYLDTRAEQVWLIAPRSRTATVFRADGSARLLRDQDLLDGERTLPGLSIPLADLFGG